MSDFRTSLRVFFTLVIVLFAATSAMAECTRPAWDDETHYTRGDKVSYQDHEWNAKRDSFDVPPGSHKPTWRDLGVCDAGPGPDPDPDPDPDPPPGSDIQIYGVWHAGNHYADWANPMGMAEFDHNNRWLIERDGPGSEPSVNLVILSFLNPLDLLGELDVDEHVYGVPVGMSHEIVDYFKSRSIRVMMSIGGQTYVDFWNEAMATDADAWQLGLNAAYIAAHFQVGMEIDYEENTNPDVEGLDLFIEAYRSVHPYDATGANPAARLTIDLAAGGRYLQDLNRYATEHWLQNDSDPDDGIEERVLDYANAMVARSSGTPTNWQEHVDGKPTYDPVIPPKAPNKFTGGLYVKGNMANCTDFESSEQAQHAEYVMTVQPAPGVGETAGMLGYMFWATGVPSARKNYRPTYPPNSCEGGMGVAAEVFVIPIPMEPLRQK